MTNTNNDFDFDDDPFADETDDLRGGFSGFDDDDDDLSMDDDADLTGFDDLDELDEDEDLLTDEEVGDEGRPSRRFVFLAIAMVVVIILALVGVVFLISRPQQPDPIELTATRIVQINATRFVEATGTAQQALVFQQQTQTQAAIPTNTPTPSPTPSPSPTATLAGLPGDLDGDGIPDATDDDIDNDGLPNDSDPDIDNDGIPNAADNDSNGNGIPDEDEQGGGAGDLDGDGIPNESDDDIDGDGLPNASDDDIDGDSIPNADDPDANGNGIPDTEEAPGTEVPPLIALTLTAESGTLAVISATETAIAGGPTNTPGGIIDPGSVLQTATALAQTLSPDGGGGTAGPTATGGVFPIFTPSGFGDDELPDTGLFDDLGNGQNLGVIFALAIGLVGVIAVSRRLRK